MIIILINENEFLVDIGSLIIQLTELYLIVQTLYSPRYTRKWLAIVWKDKQFDKTQILNIETFIDSNAIFYYKSIKKDC